MLTDLENLMRTAMMKKENLKARKSVSHLDSFCHCLLTECSSAEKEEMASVKIGEQELTFQEFIHRYVASICLLKDLSHPHYFSTDSLTTRSSMLIASC
jgi:hypothetical protein